MFLDDSACNLASLNLMKFQDERRHFDVEDVPPRRAGLTILAQEIIVDNAATRPRRSPEQPRLPPARPRLRQPRRAADGASACPTTGTRAAPRRRAITSMMCGEAYRASSAQIAADRGPFVGYAKNERAVPARHAHAPRRA
jgi:ribonucleoside-diphosphate reductase alpha chain